MEGSKRSRRSALTVHVWIVLITALIVWSPTLYRQWISTQASGVGPQAAEGNDESPKEDVLSSDAQASAGSKLSPTQPRGSDNTGPQVAHPIDGLVLPAEILELVTENLLEAVSRPRLISQSTERYIARYGDRLDEIAEEHYGSKEYWPDLMYLLGLRSPQEFRAGTLYYLPTLRSPAGDGEVLYEIGATYFRHQSYAKALRIFEHISNAEGYRRDVVVNAMFSAGRCFAESGGFREWTPDHLPVRHEKAAGLTRAADYFQRVVDEHPEHALADDALRMRAGCLLRLGRYTEAVDEYDEVASRWPDGDAVEGRARDLQWCLLALAFQMKTIPPDARGYLISQFPTQRDGWFFRDGRHVLYHMSAAEFREFAFELGTDEETADVYYRAKVSGLPLRSRGFASVTLNDARLTSRWLERLGHLDASVAIADRIWAQEPLDRRDAFTFDYLRSLIRLGRERQAIRVAIEARLPEIAWVILGNLVTVTELQSLIEYPPAWLDPESRDLVHYAWGLRLYGSGSFEEAWNVLWDLHQRDADAPIAAFARTRLCELYHFVWPNRLESDWDTSRDRLMAVGTDGTLQIKSIAREALGLGVLDDRSRVEVLGLVRAYDEIETKLSLGIRDRSNLPLTRSLQRLARDAMHLTSFESMPASSQSIVARSVDALRTISPREVEDDRGNRLYFGGVMSPELFGFLEPNRWEKFHYVLHTVVGDYVRARRLDGTLASDSEFLVVLDLAWNLLRLCDVSENSRRGPASRWYSLARYYMNFDPFLMPGARGEDNWAQGLLSSATDPTDEVFESRLRGARYRVAEWAYRRSLRFSPRDQDANYGLGDALHRRSTQLWSEFRYWWRDSVQTLEELDLIDEDAGQALKALRLEDLDRSVPSNRDRRRMLTAPFRDLFPRMSRHDELVRQSFLAYERAADLEGSLADEALSTIAETVNARGLGSVQTAIDYYDRAIALEGDRQELIRVLRRAAADSANDPGPSPEIKNLAALLLGTDRFRSVDSRGQVRFDAEGWIGDPLASYLEFRAAIARSEIGLLPGLMDRVVGDDWSHPMVIYLLELWSTSLSSDADREQLSDVLLSKLGSRDLGAIQFYVRTILARTLIDLGQYTDAYEHLVAAREETPFREDLAIALEFHRLSQRVRGVSEIESEWCAVANDVQFAFRGVALIPVDRVVTDDDAHHSRSLYGPVYLAE